MVCWIVHEGLSRCVLQRKLQKARQGEKVKNSVQDCTPCPGKRHWNDVFCGVAYHRKQPVSCNAEEDTAQTQKQSQPDKNQEERNYANKSNQILRCNGLVMNATSTIYLRTKQVPLPMKDNGCCTALKHW